jgi:hypothetical protein
MVKSTKWFRINIPNENEIKNLHETYKDHNIMKMEKYSNYNQFLHENLAEIYDPDIK